MEKIKEELGHSIKADIMIGDSLGQLVPIGSIEIKSDSILVEPWMIEEVIKKASNRLSRYVLNYSKEKDIH